MSITNFWNFAPSLVCHQEQNKTSVGDHQSKWWKIAVAN